MVRPGTGDTGLCEPAWRRRRGRPAGGGMRAGRPPPAAGGDRRTVRRELGDLGRGRRSMRGAGEGGPPLFVRSPLPGTAIGRKRRRAGLDLLGLTAIPKHGARPRRFDRPLRGRTGWAADRERWSVIVVSASQGRTTARGTRCVPLRRKRGPVRCGRGQDLDRSRACSATSSRHRMPLELVLYHAPTLVLLTGYSRSQQGSPGG